MAKKTKAYPKTLYVAREGEGENEYLNAAETYDGMVDIGSTRKVAVYQLVETKILRGEIIEE